MNSGIDDEVTPSSTIARSALPSRRRAAYSPAAMLIGIVMSRARPASLAERPAAAEDLGQDRLAGHERFAEVERDDALRSTRRSGSMQRPVGAEPLVEGVDALLRRERPEDRPPDVARQDVGDR